VQHTRWQGTSKLEGTPVPRCEDRAAEHVHARGRRKVKRQQESQWKNRLYNRRVWNMMNINGVTRHHSYI
jgi:hypothetical protein